MRLQTALAILLLLIVASGESPHGDCVSLIQCCASGASSSPCCKPSSCWRDAHAINAAGIMWMMGHQQQQNQQSASNGFNSMHNGLSLLRLSRRLQPSNMQFRFAEATGMAESPHRRDRMRALHFFLSHLDSNPGLRFNAAICAKSLDKFRVCVDALAHHDPADAESAELRAACAYGDLSFGHFDHKVEEAVVLLQNALAMRSLSPERRGVTLRLLVQVLTVHGRCEEAVALLDRIDDDLRGTDSYDPLRLQKAACLEKIGRLDKSLILYESFLGEGLGASAEVVISLSKVLVKLGRRVDAVHVLLKGVETVSERRWMLTTLATTLMEGDSNLDKTMKHTMRALTPLNQTSAPRGKFEPIDIPVIHMPSPKAFTSAFRTSGGMNALPAHRHAPCTMRSSVKGAIVYKTGKDNYEDLLRSLELLQYHQNYDTCHDIVVFHEGLSEHEENQIRSVASPAKVILENVVDVLPTRSDAPRYCCGTHPYPIAYRQMCAFFSFTFFQLAVMQNYDYYWRLDTDAFLLGSMPEDPMTVLDSRNMDFAFVAAHTEPAHVVRGLKQFAVGWGNDAGMSGFAVNMSALHEWNGTCVYTNFEAGRLSFFRSNAYKHFAAHVERSGGNFLYRWGDGPLRMIAVRALLDDAKVIRLDNAMYWHKLFVRVPAES